MRSIPVSIEQVNGHVVATALSLPDIRVEANTEAEAIDAIRNRIREDIDRKKIVMVDIDLVGLSGIFGKYKDDDELTEICNEAYRLRDEQKKAEFPDDCA